MIPPEGNKDNTVPKPFGLRDGPRDSTNLYPHPPRGLRKPQSAEARAIRDRMDYPDIAQMHVETVEEPWLKRLGKYIHNTEAKTYCDRDCNSWLKFVVYIFMYLVFLSTFTLMILYVSLAIIKMQKYEGTFDHNPEISLVEHLKLRSSDYIGLSGVPLEEHDRPLIWYRNDKSVDYDKYVAALSDVLEDERIGRSITSNLGPCGQHPYGYGDKPCIIIRLNGNKWTAKPLKSDSQEAKYAPLEVQKWIASDPNKYWLHCKGVHSYDEEHIGSIKYYPHPPGLDSLNNFDNIPSIIAVQISNFTLGISLCIECKLWHDAGVSSMAFMLYVSPKDKTLGIQSLQY